MESEASACAWVSNNNKMVARAQTWVGWPGARAGNAVRREQEAIDDVIVNMAGWKGPRHVHTSHKSERVRPAHCRGVCVMFGLE
jgi:hypothetical protein